MTQYQSQPPAAPAGFLPLNVTQAQTYRGTTGSQPVFAPGVYVATVTNIEQGPMFRDSGAVGLHVALAIAERPDGGGRRREMVDHCCFHSAKAWAAKYGLARIHSLGEATGTLQPQGVHWRLAIGQAVGVELTVKQVAGRDGQPRDTNYVEAYAPAASLPGYAAPDAPPVHHGPAPAAPMAGTGAPSRRA